MPHGKTSFIQYGYSKCATNARVPNTSAREEQRRPRYREKMERKKVGRKLSPDCLTNSSDLITPTLFLRVRKSGIIANGQE